MSQADALRAMDATIMAVMQAAGIADRPVFRPKGSGPDTQGIQCDVYVDRDVRLFGDDDAEVATPHIVVTMLRAQVEPHRGATITVGDETFKLEAELTKDESRARWVVLS